MTKKKPLGRPPISDKPFTEVIPVVRCSKEMSDRLKEISTELKIDVSELIRAYVHFCTLRQPSTSAKTLIKASRNVGQD